MEIIENETPIEERLPWHKPEVVRLHVSLDTKFEIGSGTDATDRSLLPPG